MKTVRLDKFLADAGVGTRSEVKKQIQKGLVQVNGAVVKDSGYKVTVPQDRVSAGGKYTVAAEEFEYYLFHKPAGCVSATSDNFHQTVLDYFPESKKELFPVGRLDKDTEGLLLITNDGDLAHQLLSPGKHVEKTYFARVAGQATQNDVAAMKCGVDIGEKKLTLPAKLVILRTEETADGWVSEVELTICEGKFHQVKRMMEAVGKKVMYLKRISMGPLSLPEDLEKGQYRRLTKEEISQLKSKNRNI